MPFSIVRDDLANMRADAVVLPANEQLRIDGGAGAAVAEKAGAWRLRRACRKLGGCPVGQAVATRAFSFPAKHLIHAVGPVWGGGEEDARLLRSAYDAALNLAADLKCQSVALPLLSAGLYGCPAHISLSIALSSIEDFLAESDMDVTLVLFDKRAAMAGSDFLGEIESRIDDAYAEQYGGQRSRQLQAAEAWWLDEEALEMAQAPDAAPSMPPAEAASYQASMPALGGAPSFGAAPASAPRMGAAPVDGAASTASLEQLIDCMDEGFSHTLLELIDESGMTDAQVYRRANMSRQHFSKIRSNAGYHPSKATVLALCVALELDINQTRDLLERAGFALTHASKFDIVVEYFIEHGIYDQFKINEALFYFDQPLLGG